MDGDKFSFGHGVPPSLLLLISTAGSILLSYGITLGKNADTAAGFVILLLSVLLAAYITRQYNGNLRGYITRGCVYIVITTLCATIPAIAARSRAAGPPAPSGKQFVARIVSIEEGRYSDRVVLSLSAVRTSGIPPIKAIGFSKHGERSKGDVLAVSGEPEKITADDPFASKRYEGIHFKIRITNVNCALISKGRVSFRERIRESIIRRNTELYGGKAGAVISALYLGDGYFIDRKTGYDFTRAGVLHILAASGSHVAIVAGIPLFILFLLPVPRRLSFVIVSVLLAAYYHITCEPVSLFRACVMFWIVAIFRISGERCSPLNALCLSGSVILIIHPWEIYSLGFQLSFGATAGIIILYRLYRDCMPGILGRIGNSLALTFSAQIGVFPVIAVTLNQINFTGICANLIIVPLMELLMTGSIVVDALSFAGIPLNRAGNIISSGMTFTLDLCEDFARIPGHFVFDSIPPYFIIPYAALLVPVLFRTGKYAFHLTCAAIISALIPCCIMFNARSCPDSAGTSISGISSREDMIRKEQSLRAAGYRIPLIDLHSSTYDSIHWTERFIQRNPVSGVRISRSISLTPAFRSLCETIEREGIPLTFTGQTKK